jgi:hypothetical protein
MTQDIFRLTDRNLEDLESRLKDLVGFTERDGMTTATKRQIFLWTIAATVLVVAKPNVAFGDSEVTPTAEVRTAIVQIVRQAATAVDPDSQVTVKLVARPADRRLPGTSFTFAGGAIANRELNYELAQVTILTASGSLPLGTVDLVSELVKEYAEKVEVVVKKLPAGFVAATTENRAKGLTTESSRPWEAPLAEALAKTSDLVERGATLDAAFEEVRGVVRYATYSTVGLAGMMILFGAAWFWTQRRTAAQIAQGFRDVAAALDTGGSGRAPLSVSPIHASRDVREPLALPGDKFDSLAALPDDGLLALLADCYWTGEDAYGSYLWRRIPADRKLKLLNGLPALAAYGAFVSNVPERNLGFDQDPSYLRPMPIDHLDMKEVTTLVRENPHVITLLSPLRAAALQLSPTERMKLHEAAVSGERLEGLRVMPPIPGKSSPARVLKQPLRLHIRSETDELEILSFENPTLEMIEQVPSLGWLLKLPEDRIEALLRSFSARDLATAWIGPEHVLETLGRCLGEKKQTLLKSHLERVIPSRSSEAFLALHQAVVEEIRQQDDGAVPTPTAA